MKRTKFPIELICSKVGFKDFDAITGVLIDNGYAIAIDGTILVIMNLKDMQMECLSEFDGKIIKADVFKRINNSKSYPCVFDGKLYIDSDIIGNPFISGAIFPNYRDVLTNKSGEIGIIGIDAEKMANIQKAFNCKYLCVSFGESNNNAMSIKPDFSVDYDFQAICIPNFSHKQKPFTLKSPNQLEKA
ncbi:MAG: hypothetical protein [Cryophage ML09]|nr:MAG: hypothetical protein [Cryophage ML09]